MFSLRSLSSVAVCRMGAATFVASVVAVHALWVMSMYSGSVPWCFPYWDGAISVSYAIRTPPVLPYSKAALTVTSVVMMIYWWFLVRQAGWHRRPAGLAALSLGLVSCLCLWVYLYALGIDGDGYRSLRRVGTYGHIACGTLAQIIATGLLWRQRCPASLRLLMFLWFLIGWMLFIAAVGIPWLAAYTSLSQARRTVEWHYFVCMYLWFAISGRSRRLQDARGLPLSLLT